MSDFDKPKTEEILDELERGVRAFVECIRKSKEEAIDDFDRLRNLETAFNRLFIQYKASELVFIQSN